MGQELVQISNLYGRQSPKVAGLFAAMNLTLSAGAVNPAVHEAIRQDSPEFREECKRNAMSLKQPKDDWFYLSEGSSVFSPGMFSASALLPVFVNLPTLGSPGQLQGIEGSNNGDVFSFQTGDKSGDENDKIDGAEKRDDAVQKVASDEKRADITDEMSESEDSKSDDEASSVSGRSSSLPGETVVQVAGKLLTGDEVEFNYAFFDPGLEGINTVILQTDAPTPTYSARNTLSDPDNVFAATGLYRTIVGPIPRNLKLKEPESNLRASVSKLSKSSSGKLQSVGTSEEQFNRTLRGSASEGDIREMDKARSKTREDDLRVFVSKSNAKRKSTIPVNENPMKVETSFTGAGLSRKGSKIQRQHSIEDEDVSPNYVNIPQKLPARRMFSDVDRVVVLQKRTSQFAVGSSESVDLGDISPPHHRHRTTLEIHPSPSSQRKFVSVTKMDVKEGSRSSSRCSSLRLPKSPPPPYPGNGFIQSSELEQSRPKSNADTTQHVSRRTNSQSMFYESPPNSPFSESTTETFFSPSTPNNSSKFKTSFTDNEDSLSEFNSSCADTEQSSISISFPSAKAKRSEDKGYRLNMSSLFYCPQPTKIRIKSNEPSDSDTPILIQDSDSSSESESFVKPAVESHKYIMNHVREDRSYQDHQRSDSLGLDENKNRRDSVDNLNMEVRMLFFF